MVGFFSSVYKALSAGVRLTQPQTQKPPRRRSDVTKIRWVMVGPTEG